MKKILVGLVGLSMFAIPFASFASTPLANCSFPPDHKIYNSDNNAVVSCIKADAWSKAMSNSSQTVIGALPTFASGTSITDAHGVVYECPVWFGMFRCVDSTKTAKYKSYMEGLARELISKGIAHGYPAFSGWIASVR